MPGHRRLTVLLLLALLGGCEMLGIDSPEKLAAWKEGEGKAIGGACRHASRAIEDCYTLNPKVRKAAVFAGWREMDEYMRENKIEGLAPIVARAAVKSEPAAKAEPAAAADAKAGAERKATKPSEPKAAHSS